MSREKRNLAVVIGPPSNRKMQEVALYENLTHFETKFVLSSLEKPWVREGVSYTYADFTRLLPDFLAEFAVRKPYSPVSFVKLVGLEKSLIHADVINSIELYSFISRQCAKIAKKNGSKLVVNVFETLTSLPLHKAMPFARNVAEVLKQADELIAYTSRSAEYMLHLSASKDKIKVVYPGVDLQKFFPSKEQNHDGTRILFVGGFAGEKGLALLLEAFSKLYADEHQTELWICAEPRSEKEAALIKAYMRKHPVTMFGFVDHGKMAEVYRQCDIFCLPSLDKKKFGVRVWEEQFGFALVEAMASGLPIVATNCGAIPEIIGEENLIVPQKSTTAVYEALSKLVKDDDCRLRAKKENRIRAEKLFNIIRQRAIMDKMLNELFD